MNFTNKTKKLIFNRIKLQTILGFDLGIFLSDDKDKNTFNSLRGNRKWLEIISEKIKASQQHYEFGTPKFTFSSYDNTDRRERSTFSIYYSKTLMPLSISIPTSKYSFIVDSNINVEFKSIKIGINGSVTLTSESSYKGLGLSCDNFIENYNNIILNRIKNNAYSITKELIEMLKSPMSVNSVNLDFKPVENIREFEKFIYYFDVIDFDYTISQRMFIYDLYKDDDLLKQLARMFRMSSNDYKNHDIKRIKFFLDDNIGYRKDELWQINEDRIVRYYPEAKDKNSEFFFEDVILGCEIFIQYKVALLYINQWIAIKYSKIKKNSTLKDFKIIEATIFEILNLVNISDDFYVQMNIKHRFFSEIMEHLIKKLGLIPIIESNRNILSSLFEQLSSISSIKLNKSMNWFTKAMLGVTIAMFVVTSVQLASTIYQIFKIK